jgi:hypothetical protein
LKVKLLAATPETGSLNVTVQDTFPVVFVGLAPTRVLETTVGAVLSSVIVTVRFVVAPALLVAETFMLPAAAEVASVHVTLLVPVLLVQFAGHVGNVVEPIPDSGSLAVIVNELPAACLKKTALVPFVVTLGPDCVIANVGGVVSMVTLIPV